MTDEAKITLVKAMSDETDEEVISAFLTLAGDAIYNYCDPFATADKETVLTKYGSVQAKAAAYYLNKKGWDFQTSHSENGVNRNFETGDLPNSILRELTPIAGAVKRTQQTESSGDVP